jgi:hypothetical protein
VYGAPRHQEFIRFLERMEAVVPAGELVHGILDNYSRPRARPVRAWLNQHPRSVLFHACLLLLGQYTVETFFASLTRGAFHSLVDLRAAINPYLGEHNRQLEPFLWPLIPTASAGR